MENTKKQIYIVDDRLYARAQQIAVYSGKDVDIIIDEALRFGLRMLSQRELGTESPRTVGQPNNATVAALTLSSVSQLLDVPDQLRLWLTSGIDRTFGSCNDTFPPYLAVLLDYLQACGVCSKEIIVNYLADPITIDSIRFPGVYAINEPAWIRSIISLPRKYDARDVLRLLMK